MPQRVLPRRVSATLGRVLAIIAVLGGICASSHAQSRNAKSEAVISLSGAWLDWHAPEGCMSERVLREAAEQRLGRRVFNDRAGLAAVELRGEIHRDREGVWSATFELLGPEGQDLGRRQIVAHVSQCRELDNSIVLVVTLLIDKAEDEIRIELDEPAPQRPLESVERPPRVAPPAQRRWSWEAAIGGNTITGYLPKLGKGPSASVRMTPPQASSIRLAYELRASGWFPEPARKKGVGGDLWAVQGSLAACPTWKPAPEVSVGGCAGLQLGAIHVESRGFETSFRDNVLVIDGVVRAEASIHWENAFGLRAAAGAYFPASRHRFVFSDEHGEEELVHKLPVVAFIFGLEAVVGFF